MSAEVPFSKRTDRSSKKQRPEPVEPSAPALDVPTTFWEKTYPQLKQLAETPDEVDELSRQFASRERVAQLVGVDGFRSLADALRPAGYVEEAVPEGDLHKQTIFEKGEDGEGDYLQIRIGEQDTYDYDPFTQFAYERNPNGGESLQTSHRQDGLHRELDIQLFPPGDETDAPGFQLEIMEKRGLFGIPAQIMVKGKESAEGTIDLVDVHVNIPPEFAKEAYFIADHSDLGE